MLSLLVEGTDVFTGDTLFKNSVGGVRAPGHTTYADLKRSIMDVLLALPPETHIRPGHTDPTHGRRRVGEQRLRARVARPRPGGLDEPCTALGEPATLVLLGDDYDGGHKAWVRWPDGARRHRARAPRSSLASVEGRELARPQPGRRRPVAQDAVDRRGVQRGRRVRRSRGSGSRAPSSPPR